MFMVPEDISIVVRVIPHAAQRYPTVGDWFYSNNILHILVSDMGNEDYHNLVAVHEIFEAFLCKKEGISEESVTLFDMEFEQKRASKVNPTTEEREEEPGDCEEAPYFKQHQFATQLEKILSVKLGVNWEEYNAAVSKL